MSRLLLAALLTAVALSGPALAQTAVAPPQAASDQRNAGAGVERHIAGLHRTLAITPAQEPQWAASADVMRQNAQRMQAAYAERTRMASMSAVDDMRSYAGLARAHADDLQRLVGPFEAVYASMSPEQKAVADKTLQSFQGRGDRRRGLRG